MAQQINDNFQLLAGLPIDDRIKKSTIAERDGISSTRRFQGLQCFVEQTQTLYMLSGGILNSNWVGVFGGNIADGIETVIEGFYVLSAGKETLLDWEVGDKFRGWIGSRYVVGEILSLPVSLPSDIDNVSKVELDVDSDNIASNIYYLSQQGCVSDAILDLGSTTYGTDNTVAIQTVLNKASDGTPIKIIVDGKYSTNGLIIYSNTTIEANSQSSGFILRANANAPMFINSTLSTSTISNQNIIFKGGTYNFNGSNQVHHNVQYGVISGINLVGIKNVWIQDIIFYQPSTYATWLINWDNVHIEGCKVDVGSDGANRDGFHFNGPGINAFVENNVIRSKDDAIAFNADDADAYTPYSLTGTMQNIFIRNNVLADGLFGVRVLSGASKVSNVLIDGLYGETSAYAIIIDNFWQQHATLTTIDGPGNIDDLTIKNINVKVKPIDLGATIIYKSIINISVIVRNLIIDNVKRDYAGYTGSSMIIIDQPDTVIENATITNIYDWVVSDNSTVPLLSVGTSTIKKLTLSNIYKKRSALVDAPLLDLATGTINEIILDNAKTDNVRTLLKLGTGSTVDNIKVTNVSALNKTDTYPVILNNTSVSLLESKNSIHENFWSGSGTIAKVWLDNNFPQSVYGITESLGLADNTLATTFFVDRDFVKKRSPQYIGGTVAPTDAVLELTENSSFVSALRLTNRNNNHSWDFGVDLGAVDDGTWFLFDKTTGQTRLSVNASGVIRNHNLTGTGTRQVVADASGNLSATSTPPDSRPYKVYSFSITQSGTSAPTVSVSENTLGGTVVWTRTGIGIYRGTLVGAFPVGKSYSPGANTYKSGLPTNVTARRASNDYFEVVTLAPTGGQDGLLDDVFLEFKVYN